MNRKLFLMLSMALVSADAYCVKKEKSKTALTTVTDSLKDVGKWALHNKGTIAGIGAVSYLSLNLPSGEGLIERTMGATLDGFYRGYDLCSGAHWHYERRMTRDNGYERQTTIFHSGINLTAVAVRVASSVLWYGTLAYLLAKSLALGNKLSAEAQERDQKKGFNELDWSRINSFTIGDICYTKGYQIINFYKNNDASSQEALKQKEQFSKTVKNLIDTSNEINTRATINEAFELIKLELRATFSDSSYKNYSNAGLKLAYFVWEKRMGNKNYPENIATWLLDSDEAAVFSTIMDNVYFEDLLADKEFLCSQDIIKKWYDPAQLFSLQKVDATLLNKRIPWWQCSSLSRNGAAIRAIALFKQYYFLLALRTALPEMTPEGKQYHVHRFDAAY